MMRLLLRRRWGGGGWRAAPAMSALPCVVSGQGVGGVANSCTGDKSQVWHGDLPFVLEGNTPFQLRLVKIKRLLLSQSSSAAPFTELFTPGRAPGLERGFRSNRACSWRAQMLGSPRLPDLKLHGQSPGICI